MLIQVKAFRFGTDPYAGSFIYRCLPASARRMMNSVADKPCRGGYTLFYIAGKGDWKHKKDWLCEKRYWSQTGLQANRGGICRRCFATGQTWMQLEDATDELAIATAFGEDIPFLACK